MARPGAQSPFAMIASLLAALLSNATSLEVRVPGSAGTLGGTPSQDLAPEPARLAHGESHAVGSRTTRPATAEATHSAMLPNTTFAPTLPGP